MLVRDVPHDARDARVSFTQALAAPAGTVAEGREAKGEAEALLGQTQPEQLL